MKTEAKTKSPIEATILRETASVPKSVTELARAHYATESVTHNQRNAVNRAVHRLAARREVVTYSGTDEPMTTKITTRRTPWHAAPCSGDIAVSDDLMESLLEVTGGLSKEQAKSNCVMCWFGVHWREDEPNLDDGEWSDADREQGERYGWHTWRPRAATFFSLLRVETEREAMTPRRALWVWSPDAYAERMREQAASGPGIFGSTRRIDEANTWLSDWGYSG